METKKRFEPINEERHIYEDEQQHLWVFYKIAGKLTHRHFGPSADGSASVELMMGFCAGMTEAERQINTTTIFWLTPDDYVKQGGTLDA